MKSLRNVAALLMSVSLFGGVKAAADTCEALTCEQENLIGLSACTPAEVIVRSVPKIVTEYHRKPTQASQQRIITPGNLIGLLEGSTNAFGSYEASYVYSNYNQCYDFEPVGDMEVYVNFGQSDEAGLYCYYSNWGCYGEEVCIKNNGVTLIPVSEEVKKTGIKSTMLKHFDDANSNQEDITESPNGRISWVY